MSKSEMLRALAGALASHNDDSEDDKPPLKTRPMQARILLDMLGEIRRPNPFKAGDLVEQIKAYDAYRYPEQGKLGMVTANFTQGEFKSNTKHNQREDMAILCEVDDRWVEFTVESWRFQKYKGPVE